MISNVFNLFLLNAFSLALNARKKSLAKYIFACIISVVNEAFLTRSTYKKQASWHISVILALKRLKLENDECNESCGYILRLCLKNETTKNSL